MKFVLVSVYIFVLIGQGWTDCPNQLYPSFNDAFLAIDSCILPKEKLNADCISVSCPELKNSTFCPYSSNDDYNIDVINKSLEAASKCFQRADTICGVPIKSIQIPTLSLSLLNTMPPLDLNLTAGLISGASSVSQLSQTTFYLISTSNPQNIIVDINNPDIIYKGFGTVVLTYGGVNGTDLNPTVINVDNVTGQLDLGVNIISKILLDPTNPTFQVNQTSTVPRVQISANQLSGLMALLNAWGMLSYAVQNMVQVSDIPIALTNFLSTFVMYVLQVTAQYCQKTT